MTSSNPKHPGRRYAFSGFTLLELMVALAVFSVLSLISYRGLQTILETRDSVQSVSDQLAALQITFGLISRDLDQIVHRGIRDQLGDPMASITSDENSDPQLEFSCFGLVNRSETLSSGLIRVGYGIKDRRLSRLTWKVLDRAHDSEPVATGLLEGVIAMEVRILDRDRRWHLQWPPPGAEDGDSPPFALELTLELEDWGRITRLYRIPG